MAVMYRITAAADGENISSRASSIWLKVSNWNEKLFFVGFSGGLFNCCSASICACLIE